MRRQPNQTQVLIRPGIGIKVNEWMALYVGYAWTPTFVDAPSEVSHQHRLWEQMVVDIGLRERLDLESRTRFEQRFQPDGDDLSWRLREHLRLDWELSSGSPYGLVLWDELSLFLNDVDWGPAAGVDQNRVFLGPSMQLAGVGRLEGGYLFICRHRPTDVYAHALFVQVVVSL